jgi:RHS repeat-associated protein
VGDSFTVDDYEGLFQPAVAYGAGLYLVVFTADGSEVGGQYILPTGVLTGESFLIASGDENDTPAVDYNPTSGEFLVVWHHNYVGNNSVRARRVSAAGTLLGDQIEIAGSINAPSPAHDAAGNYLVVYACNLWPQPAGICGQRLSSDGALIGSAFTILSVATNLAAPDVAYNAQTGEYLVVARQNADGVAEDVYVRRVRSDGTVLGEATLLGAQTGQGDEFGPSAAYHPGANSYLVIWPDNRNGDWDVYGRLVDADGTPLGSTFALEVAAGDQTYMALARRGASQDLYLAYADTRNGNTDVYGERYVPPIAAFTAAPTFGNALLTVVLTNTSTAPGGITAWEWSFGDGVTSTLWSPTHTYTLYGTYAVSLAAQSGLEADRQSSQITVLNTPPPTTTVIAYAYDGLYRLTRAAYSSGETFDYEYDAVGNRTAHTRTLSSQVVTTYTYDAANRLTSVDGQAYTWDANGNLLNDGSKDYVYDQANRLTNISANGLAWSAQYNGDGARLQQVTNGVPTTYTLDLAAGLVQVLTMQDAGGTTTYLYGVTRIGEQQPGGWAYHLSDALGSVRQLTDGSAQVTLARGYMPYGEELWSLGDGSSAYGYTGEDWDSYIKLVFLRARYLQPGLGTFLSRDPWSGDDLRPESMNGWNYVEGNPVNLTDPRGNDPWWCDTQPNPDECRRAYLWRNYKRFDITLAYMHQEMIVNAQSRQVTEIRAWLDCARSSDPYIAQHAGDYALAALSAWASMVHAGGPWDHKPKLEEMLGLKQDNDYYFPIRGDSEHEYYYDIWSNIHFGYVGSAAGFDSRTLQSGAAAGDIIAGTNNETDVLSIQIGIDLWIDYELRLTSEQLHQAILVHTQDYLNIPNQTTVISWVNGR